MLEGKDDKKAESKKKVRGQNEGSIRQRKDGSWEARYTIGRDSDGKQIQKSIYGKTRPQVAKKLTKALNDINLGIYVEPSKITVSSWLDTWLEEYKKPSIKPKTYESYEVLVRKHIKPNLGNILLRDLRPEQVQKLYNDKAKEYSPRQAELIHVVLHSALDQAIENDLIIKNATNATKRPKRVKKEPRVLTPEEQEILIKAMKGDRLEAAFIVALFTGLRRGEILGLKWQDISLKDKTLRVARTLCRIKDFEAKETEAKTKLEFGPVKTAKGNRGIPLLDGVVAILKAHKKRQAAEKLRLGEGYKDNDLVFCNEFGKPLDPRRLKESLDTIVEKAGLKKVNIHALRHTFATRGLENGIELRVMQELLGHATIAMTADYSHVLQEKKRQSINKLKNVLEAASK